MLERVKKSVRHEANGKTTVVKAHTRRVPGSGNTPVVRHKRAVSGAVSATVGREYANRKEVATGLGIQDYEKPNVVKSLLATKGHARDMAHHLAFHAGVSLRDGVKAVDANYAELEAPYLAAKQSGGKLHVDRADAFLKAGKKASKTFIAEGKKAETKYRNAAPYSASNGLKPTGNKLLDTIRTTKGDLFQHADQDLIRVADVSGHKSNVPEKLENYFYQQVTKNRPDLAADNNASMRVKAKLKSHTLSDIQSTQEHVSRAKVITKLKKPFDPLAKGSPVVWLTDKGPILRDGNHSYVALMARGEKTAKYLTMDARTKK